MPTTWNSAQFYLNAERYKDAEELLATAYQVSDQDADIRDRWEDAQIRHLRQKISLAPDAAAKKKLELALFDKELKFYQTPDRALPGQFGLPL